MENDMLILLPTMSQLQKIYRDPSAINEVPDFHSEPY